MAYNAIKQTLTSIVLAASMLLGCNSPSSNPDAGRFRYVNCDSAGRVDVLHNPNHCGSCFTTCDPYARCIDGVCVYWMPDAGSRCDESVNFDLDPSNCGGCGITCPPVTDCRHGECLYPEYVDDNNRCEDASDCPEGFECNLPEGGSLRYCMDPEKMGCEFDIDEHLLCLLGYRTRVNPEDCNNYDDDRDGSIDERLTNGSCYTGPAGTEGVGTCSPGVRICTYGVWGLCVGEIWPQNEVGILACDGLDNDCNRCEDNRYDPVTGECLPPEVRLFDTVMILDVSSSMVYTIAAAKEAIFRIGAPFAGNPNYRFALLTIPYPVPGDPESAVISPLSAFGTFQEELRSVTLTGFGDEPTYDIVYLAASEMLRGLRFRDGAQRIFMLFTDEEPRSYRRPPVDSAIMCGPFERRPQDVFAVVTDMDFFSYYPCADIQRTLSDDPDQVANDILAILAAACEEK